MTNTKSSMSRLHPAHILATWFWTGLSPKAPGTIGSLAALPFGYALMYYGGRFYLMIGIVAVFVIGTVATHLYCTQTGRTDPGEVVIDEVAGQWIPLLVAGFNPLYYAIAFVLFRLFDIWKPWPIGWLDQRVKGAFGVMVDDIAAGLAAMGGLILLQQVI